MSWRGAVPVLLLVGAAITACGGSTPATSNGAAEASGAESSAISLPRGSWPAGLAFSSDGSLWITESSADAIARRRPNGTITQYPIPNGNETSVDDIVEGSDGAMWFTGFMFVGRIEMDGDFTFWENTLVDSGFDVGIPDAITVGPDDEVWYANGAVPPKIAQMTTTGAMAIPLPADDGGVDFSDLTAGPDGALWFPLSPAKPGGSRGGIGRLTTDGEHESWALPRPDSGAGAIAPGPDGALWFTEPAGYRIGRITTKGRISEFPLEPGMSPFDIVAGDDAMWFTTDKRVGRIDMDGEVTTWSVRGAVNLGALVGAPDGSFWMTDGEADKVHRFTPPR